MRKGANQPSGKNKGQNKNKNKGQNKSKNKDKPEVLKATGMIPKNDPTLARGGNDPTLAGGENKLESRMISLEIPPGISLINLSVNNSPNPRSKGLVKIVPENKQIMAQVAKDVEVLEEGARWSVESASGAENVDKSDKSVIRRVFLQYNSIPAGVAHSPALFVKVCKYIQLKRDLIENYEL